MEQMAKDSFDLTAAPERAGMAEAGPSAVSRAEIDDSAAGPVVLFLLSAVLWLLAGTFFGLAASIKFNLPDWLGSVPALTFGRIRPAHLNTMVYGWASMAGAGILVWMTARLCRVRVQWPSLLWLSALIWNLGVAAGTISLLAGYSTGLEWLEFPRFSAALIGLAFVLFALSVARTFHFRKVEHLYVSLWYTLAALLWFPILYTVANIRPYSGVMEAAMNWWYGHNALTVWFTPIGLAIAYYFIPKVLGRPIHSYYLGLLGFWSFALFYNWNGIHHLIGGPLPTWLITVSIVASIMMVLPVLAVAVNHHLTMIGHFRMLRYSPTLRFVVFGAMSYTAVSLQGSFQALRTVNEITHFTQWTIAHAHVGLYAFVTMSLFGAFYYVLPRVAKWEWPYPKLIKLHFWLVAVGVTIYVVSLTIGGLLQGLYMTDPAKPFIASVNVTKPYLGLRSLAGTLMMLGHFVFAYHFGLTIYRAGPRRFAPPWVRSEEELPA